MVISSTKMRYPLYARRGEKKHPINCDEKLHVLSVVAPDADVCIDGTRVSRIVIKKESEVCTDKNQS